MAEATGECPGAKPVCRVSEILEKGKRIDVKCAFTKIHRAWSEKEDDSMHRAYEVRVYNRIQKRANLVNAIDAFYAIIIVAIEEFDVGEWDTDKHGVVIRANISLNVDDVREVCNKYHVGKTRTLFAMKEAAARWNRLSVLPPYVCTVYPFTWKTDYGYLIGITRPGDTDDADTQ